jgi:hypothetical protein
LPGALGQSASWSTWAIGDGLWIRLWISIGNGAFRFTTHFGKGLSSSSGYSEWPPRGRNARRAIPQPAAGRTPMPDTREYRALPWACEGRPGGLLPPAGMTSPTLLGCAPHQPSDRAAAGVRGIIPDPAIPLLPAQPGSQATPRPGCALDEGPQASDIMMVVITNNANWVPSGVGSRRHSRGRRAAV